jgi:DnaK suppressor protein
MRRERLEMSKKKLHTLRENLLAELRAKNAEAAAMIDEGVPDIADQGLTENIKGFLHLLGDAKREEILEIDEALDRIRDGSYGSCLRCGDEIDIERLQLLPHTRYCVSCKGILEKEARIKAGPGVGTL